MPVRGPTGEQFPDGKVFDFLPLWREIQDQLTENGKRTLAKVVDVYAVKGNELDELKAELNKIVTDEGTVVDGVWTDTRLSMQSRNLAQILVRGLPAMYPEDIAEEAPY